jgi:hypothetical protein
VGIVLGTFAEFVKVVVELNDPRLFNDVLLAVDLKCVDEHGALMSAVQHFGWEACRVSIVQRILSTSTVCCRANFVISVFHRRMESEQIDELLQALLSLESWTDVKVHAPETSNPGMSWLKSGNFKSLVGIASLSAPQKMIAVASVRADKVFLHSVAPAVVDLVERFPNVSSLRALLRHVWELLQPMLPAYATSGTPKFGHRSTAQNVTSSSLFWCPQTLKLSSRSQAPSSGGTLRL